MLGGEPYRLPDRRLLIRQQPARRRHAAQHGQDLLRRRTRRSSPAPSPRLFSMDSWQELMNPRDLTKIVDHAGICRAGTRCARARIAAISAWPCRACWRGCPTAPRPIPVEAFAFEEDTDGRDHHKYAWMNAAYAMAVNINRSFKLYGWCTRIRGVESGGAVDQPAGPHLPDR